MQQISQYQVQVSVGDSDQTSWISGAVVTDIASGAIVTTDSAGRAILDGTYPSNGRVTISVAATGYPMQYKEIWVPGYNPAASADFPPVWAISVGLTADKIYMSPPVGTAGGAKTFLSPTGQTIDIDGVVNEYLQRVRVVVPAGSLDQDYRIGLSLIPNHAMNNAFLESIPSPVDLSAQFSIGLYDLQGNLVPSPTFDPPIRIELASASCNETFDPNDVVRFWRFDTISEVWTKDGIYSEGLFLAENSGFVEVSHFSTYTMVVQEPAPPTCGWVLTTATVCDTTSVISEVTVNCGYVGASTTGGTEQKTYFDLSSYSDNEIRGELKAELFGSGYSVSGTTKSGETNTTKYEKTMNSSLKIDAGKNGAYFKHTGVNSEGNPTGQGRSGTVKLRYLKTIFTWKLSCNHFNTTITASLVTGTCEDTSGLSDDPNCPDGVNVD